MKKGLVISVSPTQFAAVSHDSDLAHAFRNTAALGYDGVELAVRNPDGLDPVAIRQLASKFKLAVPAIGTGQAFGEEGLNLTDSKATVRKAATERLKAQAAFAAEFEAAVIIGLIRGRGTDNKERDRAYLLESLADVAADAAGMGVKLLIEPINRYETELINTVADGIELIQRLAADNVRLLLDTFHMNIEEPSICGSIVKALPYLGHVHFADSNRRFPGAGHIDFPAVATTLEAVGYQDYISMEMLPWPGPEESAGKAIQYLNQILNYQLQGIQS